MVKWSNFCITVFGFKYCKSERTLSSSSDETRNNNLIIFIRKIIVGKKAKLPDEYQKNRA